MIKSESKRGCTGAALAALVGCLGIGLVAAVSQVQDVPAFVAFSRIDEAWPTSRGAGAVVAVLDWQFDLDGDLAEKYVSATSVVPGQAVGELDPWHGEWMAELVLTVAPEASVMPIRARPLCEGDDPALCDPQAYERYAIEGIRIAADAGAVAVASSMGPLARSPALDEAVAYAEARGTLFINVHPEYRVYTAESFEACEPGECNEKILRAGIVSVPEHPVEVDPARDVHTWPYHPDPVFRDGWGFSNGPPIIAGVVALISSVDGTLSPAEIKRILVDTATSRDGFAVLDAAAAVSAAAGQLASSFRVRITATLAPSLTLYRQDTSLSRLLPAGSMEHRRYVNRSRTSQLPR